MKQQKLIISCALCAHNIFETGSLKDIDDQITKANLKKISLFDNNNKVTSYLCPACHLMMLSTPNQLKKVVKVAMPSGNSASVYVPVSWRDKRVIAYLLD